MPCAPDSGARALDAEAWVVAMTIEIPWPVLTHLGVFVVGVAVGLIAAFWTGVVRELLS